MPFKTYVVRPAAENRYGDKQYMVIPLCQNCGKRGSFNPNVMLDCKCDKPKFTLKAEVLHGLAKKGENLQRYVYKEVEYV